MKVSTLVSNEKYRISKHEKAGFQFVFSNVDLSVGTCAAAKACMTELGEDFEVEVNSSLITLVHINSGPYKGLYDTEPKFSKNQLVLLQEKH